MHGVTMKFTMVVIQWANPHEKRSSYGMQKKSKKTMFDLQKEFVEYCDSDVDILRRGYLELRNQFLEIANIDPFQYITIASVCMAIYR